MKQTFLGWFCRWLDRRGILTHPMPLQGDPCKTMVELVEAWRVTPRRLVIWRVKRTLRMIYGPKQYETMAFLSATAYDQTMPKRGLRWHVTFSSGCGWNGDAR